MRAGLALGCTIQRRSIFARKNYFYPDLPKGYQISQYEHPLATDGELVYVDDDGSHTARIIRVHLEEDAGKSLHTGASDSDPYSYLDFNRSGVPLIEIVTHPDLRSPPEAAGCFARLPAILQAIGANDGNMEEGSLRCDANVSVRPARRSGARRQGRGEEHQLVPTSSSTRSSTSWCGRRSCSARVVGWFRRPVYGTRRPAARC